MRPDVAFSLEADVYLATYAIWTDPSDDERQTSWVASHHARFIDYLTVDGAVLNEASA